MTGRIKAGLLFVSQPAFICKGNYMNLFLKSGYLDMARIININTPWVCVIGARGTGKTYGAIKYALDSGMPFIFMRRTQTQIDLIKNDSFSPFQAIDPTIVVRNINKNLTGVYRGEFDSEKQKLEPVGAPIGYLLALTTVSNIRGFDASGIDLIIYDEFIGEKHERAIKNEGNAVLNAYETINRNRELQGKDPVKMILLANSNDLVNPLFVDLKLVKIAEKLQRSKENVYINNDRGISLVMVKDSPISRKKQQTALYKLAGDGDFSAMALSNDFVEDIGDNIKPMPITEYKPLVFVGELSIYQHKSRREVYVTDHRNGTAEEIDASDIGLARFRKNYYWIWLMYLQRKVIFESYIHQKIFEKYYNIH